MHKPVATKAGGECLAVPDVCHLPAPPPPAGPGGIPTPYPNKAGCSSCDKTTKKVLAVNKPICVEDSEIPRSSGDEAGCSNLPTPKGLTSQKNMSETSFKSFSSKVKAEGKAVVFAGATTGQNGKGNQNMPTGKHVTPSQTKVWAS